MKSQFSFQTLALAALVLALTLGAIFLGQSVSASAASFCVADGIKYSYGAERMLQDPYGWFTRCEGGGNGGPGEWSAPYQHLQTTTTEE